MIKKSKKNIEVETFVDNYIKEHGTPPTYATIQNEFKISRCAAYERCNKFRNKMRRCNNITKYTIGGVSVRLTHPIAKNKIEQFISILNQMNALFIK